MVEQKKQAKTPQEIAVLSGGDIAEISAAFNSVRILRSDTADSDE
jgi:hypothetical protein